MIFAENPKIYSLKNTVLHYLQITIISGSSALGVPRILKMYLKKKNLSQVILSSIAVLHKLNPKSLLSCLPKNEQRTVLLFVVWACEPSINAIKICWNRWYIDLIKYKILPKIVPFLVNIEFLDSLLQITEANSTNHDSVNSIMSLS